MFAAVYTVISPGSTTLLASIAGRLISVVCIAELAKRPDLLCPQLDDFDFDIKPSCELLLHPSALVSPPRSSKVIRIY